jgi:DNA-binding PadR family transcriptional regulator
MYRDNSLIPSEAIRLLALGILADGATTYAELAGEVRHFTGHIVGPSLDLVGAPIEVLKVEGLVGTADGNGIAENARLHITEAGRQELTRLLNSNLRPPVSDINKLIITLKMRFLHLLEPSDCRLQAEMLAEMCERQLVRLTELHARHTNSPGHLNRWLAHEIDQTRDRLEWFRDLQKSLG